MTTPRKPQDGDILIQLAFPEDKSVKDLKQMDAKTVMENLPRYSYHAMIFQELKSEAKIHHCGFGDTFFGTKQNNLASTISKQKVDIRFGGYVGTTVVLHCKNDMLRTNLVQVASRWTHIDLIKFLGLREKATPQEVTAALQKKSKILMPTIWSNDRKKDKKANRPLFELYRAFRAHARNNSNPVTALSKKKGTNCSGFVFYSLKAAIINCCFPENVLQAIHAEMAAIEKQKTAVIKRLALIQDQTPLQNIQKIVSEFVQKPLQGETEADFQQRKKLVDCLTYPVKGKIIDNLVQFALASGLFEMSGYLCFKGKVDNAAVMVIEPDAFKKLLELNKSDVLPMAVSGELFEKLIAASPTQQNSSTLKTPI